MGDTHPGSLTDERFSRVGWLFEPKWDGERCLAFRRDGEVSLNSRNRILLNARYPEIAASPTDGENYDHRACRDGWEEVIAENGRTRFARRAAVSPSASRRTRDGKLRHPRFLGLRDDKEARDVVRESD